MSFKPRFTITNKLLKNIKEISILTHELNNKRFPNVVLMRLEKEARAVSAHTSTRIEGNPLPLTAVKKLLKNSPQNLKNTEKEVINYNKALLKLNSLIIDNKVSFNKQLILDIHKEIVSSILPKYQSGKIRVEPVVVNNPSSGETVYLPPDHEEVETLIKELIDFVNKAKDVDPLIVAGIFHKQFVVIHPFVDGNGRTCRLATKVLLASMGLNTFNLFSFENYYNNDISKYFKKVGLYGNYYDEVDRVDFTAWLEYFTDGILNEILRVKVELDKVMARPDYELSKDQNKLIGVIRDSGFITDHGYSKITERAKPTRVMDFNKLRKLGLIKRKGKGRKTYYVES